MMNVPLDAPMPVWARNWASDRLRKPIFSVIRIRSGENNTVFRLKTNEEDFFLKIGSGLSREHARLQWLFGRLPCPQPLGLIPHEGEEALLLSAMEGRDLAALADALPARTIIERLAAAVRNVHELDATEWPFGGSGAALVHGDACLPNFLYKDDCLTGYVDVGDMRLGDAEIDLAAAVWSIQFNLGPGHGRAFLHEYGLRDATDADVERLRWQYEQQ